MELTLRSLQEQINELRGEISQLKSGTKASFTPIKAGIGDTFELAGLNWKILDITDDGYMCLADRLEENMRFDSDSNNWKNSSLRKYLNEEFCQKLAGIVGNDNIISFTRDLFSLDGQTEYDSCLDKVSLLTVDEYRKYRGLIPNVDYWWWTCTPWSTPCNDTEVATAVVSSSGVICYNHCRIDFGVRPFCIFSSSIFESEE